jgi:hypothetical protein
MPLVAPVRMITDSSLIARFAADQGIGTLAHVRIDEHLPVVVDGAGRLRFGGAVGTLRLDVFGLPSAVLDS